MAFFHLKILNSISVLFRGGTSDNEISNIKHKNVKRMAPNIPQKGHLQYQREHKREGYPSFCLSREHGHEQLSFPLSVSTGK